MSDEDPPFRPGSLAPQFHHDAYERLLAVLDILEVIDEGGDVVDTDLPDEISKYWDAEIYEAESVALMEMQEAAVTTGNDAARERLSKFYTEELPEHIDESISGERLVPVSLRSYIN